MDASLYRWTIKTSDDLYSGASPGQVFLSLHGLDGAMKETLISQTKALGQFSKGTEDAGTVSVPENLGALQTGTLRCTGRWNVDWVRVRSLDPDDGRIWHAEVGKWDHQGKFPILRFKQIAAAEADSEETRQADSTDKTSPERGLCIGPQKPVLDEAKEDPELNALQEILDQLNRELDVLRLRKAVAEKRKELERASSAPPPVKIQEAPEPDDTGKEEESTESAPPGDVALTAMITFEVIARVWGKKEPFTDAVLMLGGAPIVLPGVALSVGSAPEDGFGLGGSPGRWREFYPSTPPEALGLPPGVGVLVYDGVRGHALDPATLQRLLGQDWRSQFIE